MTRHRLASVPALVVALAASAVFASAILGLGASAAQASTEWHARVAASSSVNPRPAVETVPVTSVDAAVSSAAKTAKPFPVGFIIGGVLVVVGFAGGVYGQMLRRRGRRPPGL